MSEVMSLGDKIKGYTLNGMETTKMDYGSSEITNSGGGSTSYYKLKVVNGVTFGDYNCECQDIIEQLGMTWNEANAFKSIWRKAAARQGNAKAGYDNGKRDAEKIAYAGERILSEYKEV